MRFLCVSYGFPMPRRGLPRHPAGCDAAARCRRAQPPCVATRPCPCLYVSYTGYMEAAVAGLCNLCSAWMGGMAAGRAAGPRKTKAGLQDVPRRWCTRGAAADKRQRRRVCMGDGQPCARGGYGNACPAARACLLASLKRMVYNSYAYIRTCKKHLQRAAATSPNGNARAPSSLILRGTLSPRPRCLPAGAGGVLPHARPATQQVWPFGWQQGEEPPLSHSQPGGQQSGPCVVHGGGCARGAGGE